MANKLRVLNSLNKVERRALRYLPPTYKSDNVCINNSEFECKIKDESENKQIVPLSFYQDKTIPHFTEESASLGQASGFNRVKNNIESMYCKDYISSSHSSVNGSMFENIIKQVIFTFM